MSSTVKETAVCRVHGKLAEDADQPRVDDVGGN
jgi:hypothetical protein